MGSRKCRRDDDEQESAAETKTKPQALHPVAEAEAANR